MARLFIRYWHKLHGKFPKPWWFEPPFLIEESKKGKKEKTEKSPGEKKKGSKLAAAQEGLQRSWERWRPEGKMDWRLYLEEEAV